ncbi:phospholipase A2 inhibitor and Ly6/PLAUR domain-containing protein-like isoform 2-T2 [Mantella aurantiaca]
MGSGILDLLCALCALAATGHALSCQVCMASYSLYCSGASVICPEGHVCVSSYTLTTMDGSKISEEYARACGPPSQCNQPGSVSIPRGKIKRTTACCYTDDCFPSMSPLPADSFEPNGVTCATCVSPELDYCYTQDTMRCTGNENKCILESSHYYEPIEKMLALRGCATQSICDIGKEKVAYGFLNMTMDIKCSSGSSRLYNHLVLPFAVTVAAILTVILS